MSTPKKVWEEEYLKTRSLPCICRAEPSRGLVMLDRLLPFSTIDRVLDLGCGNGRNALYLASKGLKVDAIDFSDAALAEFKRRMQESKFSKNICIINRSLLEPLPFEDATFDAAIDFYTFSQFIGIKERRRYLNEVMRVLKPKGYAVFALFSFDDEYYKSVSSKTRRRVVKDPANDIVSRLYSRDEVRKFFSMFQNLFLITLEFDDLMLENSFHRVHFILVLRRREN